MICNRNLFGGFRASVREHRSFNLLLLAAVGFLEPTENLYNKIFETRFRNTSPIQQHLSDNNRAASNWNNVISPSDK